MIIAGIVVLCAGLYYSLPHILDYIRSRDAYDEIRDEYVRDPEEEEETEAGNTGSVQPAPSVKIPEKAEDTEIMPEAETEKVSSLLSEGEILAGKYPALEVKGKALKKKNSDYVGWVYVPGTDISYPVVYTGNNDDYLHKGFNGGYSYAGTIFLDERNKGTTDEKHMILYGHNMRDGSMFAKIKSFEDQDFYEKHPVFWFITPDKAMLFQIFTAYVAQPRDFDVTYSVEAEEFNTYEEFADILKKMEEYSEIKTNVFPDSSDQIMALSTCTNARVTRFTVTGKLVYETVVKD